jgi:outer membrane protein TolC
LVLAETYDRSESWLNALTKRPDFNSAKVALEQQGIVVKLRFNQVFPALDLIGGYGVGGTDFNSFSDSVDALEDRDNNEWTVGARLSIPLGNRAARNNRKIAKESFKQIELQLHQLKETILIDVDNSITFAESSYQQIPARRSAREFAQEALDAEQKKMDNGRSTSFFVLQFQRDLTSAQSEEIRALTEYNKAVAEFYFSEGTILERNSILIENR